MSNTFEASLDDSGMVRIRLDRPGIAAVSFLGDPMMMIQQIADAAGIEVYVKQTQPEEPTDGDA